MFNLFSLPVTVFIIGVVILLLFLALRFIVWCIITVVREEKEIEEIRKVVSSELKRKSRY